MVQHAAILRRAKRRTGTTQEEVSFDAATMRSVKRCAGILTLLAVGMFTLTAIASNYYTADTDHLVSARERERTSRRLRRRHNEDVEYLLDRLDSLRNSLQTSIDSNDEVAATRHAELLARFGTAITSRTPASSDELLTRLDALAATVNDIADSAKRPPPTTTRRPPAKGAGGAAAAPATVAEIVAANRGVVALSCATLSDTALASGQPKHFVLVEPEVLPAWVTEEYRPETTETDEQRERSFSKIFEEDVWSRETPSGTGSMRGEATDRALLTIESVLDYARRTLNKPRVELLDVPCGDMNWIPQLWERGGAKAAEGLRYVGLDIVQKLVERHSARFSKRVADGSVRFLQHDVVKSPPTGVKPDVVFSRQMLQHLTTADAQRAIENFRATGARFLLTSTYPDWQPPVNTPLDVEGYGRVRKLNLNLPPFDLPPPICWDLDFSYSFLALYDLKAA